MRNRTSVFRLMPALALCLAVAPARAVDLELGAEGTFTNLQLPWTLTPVTEASFPSHNFFEGGQAWITSPLGEDASIRLDYDRDPVLRNRMDASVQFDRGPASISVGPFVGFLNSDSAPWSAGMAATLKLQWPGVAYVSFSNLGGLAASVLPIAGDPQALTELAAGVYVPHAIISGLISSKRFNETDASGNLVSDSLTRYAITVDVFKKDIPYTALFSVGYENRAKYYAASGSTDALGAVVLGVDSAFQLSQPVKLLADFSTGAYVFGLDALQGRGPTINSFLFNAGLGLDVNLGVIQPAPPKPPASQAAATPAGAAAPADQSGQPAPSPSEGDQGGAQTAAGDQGAPSVESATESAPAQDAPAEGAVAPKKPAKKVPALDAGFGFCYDALPLTSSTLDFLLAMFYTRGGIWADLMLPVAGGLSAGGELGLYYMNVTLSGSTVNLADVPLLAKVAYSFGKVRAEAYAGIYATDTFTSSEPGTPHAGFDSGLRLCLGGLYAEGSYVWGYPGSPSFLRYGIGYSIKIK